MKSRRSRTKGFLGLDGAVEGRGLRFAPPAVGQRPRLSRHCFTPFMVTRVTLLDMSNTPPLDMSNLTVPSLVGGGNHGDATVEAEVLARKLNLLIDVATTQGHTPTFREISDALAQGNVRLSRARWSYMIAGTGPVVKDHRLLGALSEFFGVDSGFLRAEPGGDVPERIEAQLDLVRAMRVARVKNFAARALGDVSPDTLRAITRFLDEERDEERVDSSEEITR